MTAALLRRGWCGGLVYPNAATTGYAAGGYSGLTPVTISTTTDLNSPGSPSWVGGSGSPCTVTGIDFTMAGPIAVEADEVTFSGCVFNSTQLAYGTGPETLILYGTGPYIFEYCTFSSGFASATRVSEIIDMYGDCALAVDHCDMSGFRQAINIASGTTLGVSITNNYLHDMVYYAGDHSEPIYAGAAGTGSNITITGNTILNNLFQTAAIYFNTVYNFTDCTISNNLLGGGTYTLYCGGSGSSGVVMTNNAFTTAYWASSGQDGPAYTSTHPNFLSGNTWSGNAYYDGPNAGVAIAAP